MEYEVGQLSDFSEEGMFTAVVGDYEVVVFRLSDGRVVALEDKCSHADVRLSDGVFEQEGTSGTIECCAHGARFDVCSGKPLCMPAVTAVPSHAVRLENDKIFVTVE